jgi:uncharacterized protein (TIGR02145 family)
VEDSNGDCPSYLVDNDGDGEPDGVSDPCLGATSYTYHGVAYGLVAIGDRCWFKENLRTTQRRDGTAIAEVPDADTWNGLTTAAYAVYGNDAGNAAMYGLLYNGYAAADDAPLCPQFWAVPSAADFDGLVGALGGTAVAGGALKEAGLGHWASPNAGATNASGFTALPGGERVVGSVGYTGLTESAWWWTSGNSFASTRSSRGVTHTSATVSTAEHSMRRGHSVRCVRLAPVLGCTNINFGEFNPLATVDDGSCATPSFPGCTDNRYAEYDPQANVDDGSCTYLVGCGPGATVTYHGESYPLVTIGAQCWFKKNLNTALYRTGEAILLLEDGAEWAATSQGAWSYYNNDVANGVTYGKLYNFYTVNDARALCPTGWHVPTDGEWITLEMELGMTSAEANGTGWRGTIQGTALKASPADSPPWNGTNSSGFSALSGGIRYGSGSFGDLGFRGIWWSSSPSGSLAWFRYLDAGNSDVFRYNDYYGYVRNGFSVRCLRDTTNVPVAILGCTLSNACNYNPSATTNNGMCILPGPCDSCNAGALVDGDLDNDGVCNPNEVPGCTDSSATNFDSNATDDDGSCLYGPAQCGGASTVTFDGYTYALVGIGTQCWFKENLRSDNYSNGDAIPGGLSDSQWTSTGSGAQAVYNNDPSNLATYGRLYNWYAVNDARGLCPVGFHVPSDSEWMSLEMELGMTANQLYGTDFRGTNQGEQLKSSLASFPSWNGTNSSGFSASPSGFRYSDYGGYYSSIGTNGYWWSSTVSGPDSWARGLITQDSRVYRYVSNLRSGLGIRCVKDIGVACIDPDNDGVCAENEVSGCTDSSATNFDSNATDDDGSCLYGPAQCSGASTVTFDGHAYALVGIGTQCWFKENLRSDNYRNGDAIPGNLSESNWVNATTGAQAVFGEGSSHVSSGNEDEELNLLLFGRLYNGMSVSDARGLCPTGFHVPTDEEWTELEIELGLTAVNGTFWRGDDHGTKLKASPTDIPPWNSQNPSGFSASPGGYRGYSNGHFSYNGEGAYYWTSSMISTSGYFRHLSTGRTDAYRWYSPQQDGYSVRCMMD